MDRFVNEFSPDESDVAVCGSMSHKLAMQEVIETLQTAGLRVSMPDLDGASDWSLYSEQELIAKRAWLFRRHLANIAKAKVVLICNFDKNDTKGYVGSSSFLEMGAAFVYNKPIYLLHLVSNQDNREEILALEPIVLEGNLKRLVSEVKA